MGATLGWLLMVAPHGGSSGVVAQGGCAEATLTISRVSQLIRLTFLAFVACTTSYLTISLGTSHPQASIPSYFLYVVVSCVVA